MTAYPSSTVAASAPRDAERVPQPALASPRWVLPVAPDPNAVAALVAALRLPETLCGLLCMRGFGEPASAMRFLRPRLDQLHDPMLMHGMQRAVDRLVRAARDGETVLVHGDYDVDGICSTTLLTNTLRSVGANAVPFIPRRLVDGYDLSMAGVRAAIAAKAGVVVTCDCGTTAREPVAALCAAGLGVIVTDHHLPGGPLPDCLAVLNPRQEGCDYPDRDLAAVGVAFKLSLAIVRALGASEAPVLRMLDLVALATVADIAPLRGENRVLVRYGLRMLAASDNVGIRALIRAAGLDGKPVTAGRVGFVLGPRLNAVGRLGHAMRGVELLLAESEHEANAIARELEELNRKRQEIDRATLAEARTLVSALDLDATFGIVLAKEGWHPGVIGIVASRIVEEFGRPTVLIALDGPEGKGSGRSITRFDLHSGLSECGDLLLRFGGHRAAAGITIAADRVADFAGRFNQVAAARLTPDDLVPELRVDMEIALGEAGSGLETLLRHLEPFGIGNPGPTFIVRGVRIARRPRPLAENGVRLCLSDSNGARLEAIAWTPGIRDAALSLGEGAVVDVAFRLERDEYRGQSRLQARVVDIRG